MYFNNKNNIIKRDNLEKFKNHNYLTIFILFLLFYIVMIDIKLDKYENFLRLR